MSNSVFPTLIGLAWNVTKTPIWSTRIQKAVSGREYRSAQYSIPLWKFKLIFDVLRASQQLQEFQTLAGFFNARQGSFDTFLYADPNDQTIAAQQFGVGDGSTKTFQLVRTFGGYTEPVLALQAQPSVYVNGVLQVSGVSANTSTAILTFTSAPAPGTLLTWSGSYYFRCRFMDDSIDFENFMRNFWQAKKVEFVSVK